MQQPPYNQSTKKVNFLKKVLKVFLRLRTLAITDVVDAFSNCLNMSSVAVSKASLCF